MRLLFKSLISGFGLVLALAVHAAFVGASAARPPAQQPPDRSAAPKPGPPPALKLPAIQKRTLSNGLPVWIVELHKVPVVHVSLAVRAGSGADRRNKFGVANLTAEMLDEGAGARDALQIADGVDYLGASLSTSSSSDAAFVELHVPAARLGDALPILSDVVLRPAFPEKELQRVREELLTSILQAQDDPASLIQFAFPRLVFGPQHRYGTMSFGTAASLKGFTVADLRQFHARHYVPSNATLIVTGDATPASVVARLESAFGAWKGTAPAPSPVPQATQLTSRQVYLIDKPGAAQSQIRIGWVGVPRSTPDYFALRVLNTVLGGAFTSRLNQNLREEHGYAYGASSSFDMRGSAGPFYAAAAVQTDKTAESLTEFFKELEAIRKPIPADELDKAKNYIALRLPRNFETTESMADSLAQIFVYNLPADFYDTFTDRIRGITPADAHRAAERYLQPDKFAVVVVGDLKAIEPGIRALNLGPITTVTIDEVLK
jgi:zinc protease